MEYILPKLLYSFDGLEPHIDARTVELQYARHHQEDVDQLNLLLGASGSCRVADLEQILRNISQYDQDVRNHGGGYYNHCLFWSILSPEAKFTPEGELKHKIDQYFGGLEALKELIHRQAAQWVGSGWVWLLLRYNGTLAVSTTPNQDNPLMDINLFSQGYPILGIDLWEHAYYLKHQNRKLDYLNACWRVLDWTKIESRYREGQKKLTEWNRVR
ncbi:MAG: superoxide dismutase [Sphingobacterium sp.]